MSQANGENVRHQGRLEGDDVYDQAWPGGSSYYTGYCTVEERAPWLDLGKLTLLSLPIAKC